MDLSKRAGSRDAPELRARKFDGVELREADGGKVLTFTGYASVFDQPYSVWDAFGEFKETIRPGTFRSSLAKGADVPFKINHEGMTLARTKSGTMDLAEDSTGLHVTARLDPTNPQVQALRSAMDRRDIDEMSFAFRVTDERWNESWDVRDILGADINKGDVSAVNYGANPYTNGATLRSLIRDELSLDRILRSGGLSPEVISALMADEPSDSEAAEPRSLLSVYAARVRLLSL